MILFKEMMMKIKRILWGLIVTMVLLLGVNGALLSQELTDDQLEKKYKAILGEYEFDLSEMGGETALLEFYIEDGELWADSGDGRPAALVPMEDVEFAFSGEDPVEGRFEFYFLKDEEGQYSKCRIVIEAMGLEIFGIKIGG